MRSPARALHPLQQADVALGSGDQFGFGRVAQAQLVQRAEAVGVAVENVNQGHGQGIVERRAKMRPL
jgi:hypothetical protein